MIVVLYFRLIRPEKKRKKEEENLRNSLKVGDRITTIGGIVGKIVELKDENIVIETSADCVRMELARFSVMTNNTAKEAAQKARAEAQAAAKAKAEEKKSRSSRKRKTRRRVFDFQTPVRLPAFLKIRSGVCDMQAPALFPH